MTLGCTSEEGVRANGESETQLPGLEGPVRLRKVGGKWGEGVCKGDLPALRLGACLKESLLFSPRPPPRAPPNPDLIQLSLKQLGPSKSRGW